MILFRPVTIEDRQWIAPVFRQANRREAENSFAILFLWQECYSILSGQTNGCYVSKKSDVNGVYGFPVGADVAGALRELMQDAGNGPFLLQNISMTQKTMLETMYPDRFVYRPVRENFDYLYEIEQMVTLSGKKLHQKRNHLNRFLEYNWSYEPITADNLAACREMNDQWYRLYAEKKDPSVERERLAIQSMFRHYFALHLQGGLLRVDGRVVAYTVGEPITEDTFLIHFEKAYTDVNGAYTAINQQFLEQNCRNYRYVNREEDMGNEGLRQAKLSYHPCCLLEKYDAILKG